MEHRQLGRDGDRVSVLGLGTWPLGGAMGAVDEATAIATVRAAIDSGITLIDTAQSYYHSEEVIGKALQDGYRQRCFLATKVSLKYSRDDIVAAMENSLRQLKVDCVDLYQIHSWNPEYPIDISMETMLRLQEQGKTRFLGVSNFDAEQMRTAARTAPFHSNQPCYNLLNRAIEEEDIPYCEREGIGILAHSALAKGLLSGRYRPGHQFPEDDERSGETRTGPFVGPRFSGSRFADYLDVAEKLRGIADEKGITMVQMAVAWLLRLPAVTCALVGAKHPDQVRDHLGAVGVGFDGGELARIDRILSEAPAY